MGDDGKLYRPDNPVKEAMDRGDYLLIPGPNNEETRAAATEVSKNISTMIDRARSPKNYQTGGLTASRSIGGGFNPDVRPVTTPQETPVGGADFSNQQNITD